MLINTSCNSLTTIASTIVSIGAINWGLVGIFNFNIIEYLLGDYAIVTKTIYALVGFSGIWTLCNLNKVLCSPGITKVK